MLTKEEDSLVESKEVRTEAPLISASYPPKIRRIISCVVDNFMIFLTPRDLKREIIFCLSLLHR